MVWELILIILGLVFFETITSIDNAIINADVLSRMSERARKWFLFWGLLFAVFFVRGLLPSLMLWATNPSLSIYEIFTATLTSDARVLSSIEQTAPVLLMLGGVFMLFLFLHWLFLEPKSFGIHGEKFIYSQGIWFYAIVSILLAVITWFAGQKSFMMAFGAVIGSTLFFITHGFKQNAESQEKELIEGKKSNMSDVSKLLYLEVIDTSFSIDGVIGAFAFTLAIPLILLGNGIGAFVVRELTIRNIDNIKKYIYLKNGAMYSIFFLGAIMVLDAFGYHIPSWLSPIITFGVVGFFFWKSKQHIKAQANLV
ncbi:MAG: DUF475 domain-containing protein [Candidatus Micrarchaeota archaeon]